MTLLATYAVVLHHWTGDAHCIVGTDIANRNHLETEGLIGFFVNELVLRISVASSPTFRELLAQVRETTLGAYAHQELPFDLLVADLRPQRSATLAPFFQTKLVLQNARTEAVRLPGLSISSEPLERGFPGSDLAMLVAEVGDGLELHVLYSGDVFSSATIASLGSYWTLVMREAAADPDVLLAALDRRLSALDADKKTEATAQIVRRRSDLFAAAAARSSAAQ